MQREVVGGESRERDKDDAGHSPGEAHHQGGNGARLAGREILRHDDIHGIGGQQNEATEGETDQRNRPAGIKEKQETRNREKQAVEDDAASAEAVGEMAASEAADGAHGGVHGERETGGCVGEAALLSEIERQKLREADLNDGPEEDEHVKDEQRFRDGAKRSPIDCFFLPSRGGMCSGTDRSNATVTRTPGIMAQGLLRIPNWARIVEK